MKSKILTENTLGIVLVKQLVHLFWFEAGARLSNDWHPQLCLWRRWVQNALSSRNAKIIRCAFALLDSRGNMSHPVFHQAGGLLLRGTLTCTLQFTKLIIFQCTSLPTVLSTTECSIRYAELTVANSKSKCSCLQPEVIKLSRLNSK